MRRTGKAIGTLAAATSLAVVVGGLAFADEVNMTDTVEVQAGGGGDISVILMATDKQGNDTDVPGCNATATAPVTINLSSNKSWATLSPASVTVEDCVTPKTVRVSAAAGTAVDSTATITGTASGGQQDVSVQVKTGRNTTTEIVDSVYKDDKVTVKVVAPPDPCASVTAPAAPTFHPAGSTTAWLTSAPSYAATTAGADVKYFDGTGFTLTTPPALSEGPNVIAAKAFHASCPLSSDASSATYNLDSIAPTVKSPGNSTSWSKAASVTSANFTASDDTSGLADAADASFTLMASDESTKSSLGVVVPTAAERIVRDAAGNPRTARFTALIDRTSPTDVAFGAGGIQDGGVYYTTQVPAAPSCSASDALSGFASCEVTGRLTTAGSHKLTATATDNAGNESTIERNYTVRDMTHTGIYSPVDMGGVVNTVKAGSTVPLKFNVKVDGVEQTATNIVSFAVTKSTCVANAAEDAITVLTSGTTSLRYEDGQYFQNWKTPTGAGVCYKATVTLADGDSMTALFKTK